MCAPVAHPRHVSHPASARAYHSGAPSRRHRDRLREPLEKYVRRHKGRFQARLWIARPGHRHKGGFSINLGLYETERMAAEVRKQVVRRLAAVRVVTPLDVWLATRAAIAAGYVREGVLPMFVRRVAEGAYVARAKVNDAVVELGPFACPGDACAAMCDRLRLAN